MTNKLIHNEEADQHPVRAVIHARMMNAKYSGNHSFMTKSSADVVRQLAEAAYTRSRVFVNNREKFIAVKVMNVDPRDSFNVNEQTALEDYVSKQNIQVVRTGKRSIIYRVK